MKLLNAIWVATAAEACLFGAVFGLASLAGSLNGWLDVVAQLAPVWLALSLAGGAIASVAIERGGAKVVVLALAATGLLSSGWLIAPELARAFPTKAPRTLNRAAPLKVITFNTWSDNLDPSGSVDAVLRAKADVVALQETSGLGSPERLRLREAYPYWTTCRPAACDLILMSKMPWTGASSPKLPMKDGDFELIWATTLAPDGRPFTIATTHYAWPFPPARQAAERAALVGAIHAISGKDLVLTGDFNLTPWSAALRTQDAALAPLQRRTHAVFTWPANIAIVNWPTPFPLLPIDHVYAGPAWQTRAVTRLPRLGSDHYPVLVELVRSKFAD